MNNLKVMWIKELENLDHLKKIIVENLAYDDEKGYTFLDVFPGMEILDISSVLGKPNIEDINDDSQQLLYYYALINHPKEGESEFNKLTLLSTAYNRDPVKKILLHIVYSNIGEDAEAYRNFIVSLIKAISEKFGKPEKKSLRKRKSTIKYQIRYSELDVWESSDGLRIQMKDKSPRKKN